MATSICQLITARQRELWSRCEALQRVCQEDGGSLAEDVQLSALIDELDFIMELSKAYLEHLQETHRTDLTRAVPKAH